MPLTLLKLPKSVTESIPLNGQVWKISLYDEYLPHFKNENGDFCLEIKTSLEKHAANPLKRNYRAQIHLKTTPFLVGFLFDEKEIVITTTRMHRELFLIQEIEKNNLYDRLDEKDRQVLESLAHHTHKMISIPMDEAPTLIESLTASYHLPNFFEDAELQDIGVEAQRLEDDLMEKMEGYHASLFEKISDRVVQWVARYSVLRIHLLKFVALLPSLDHDKKGTEVKRILIETLRSLLADALQATSHPPSWMLNLLRVALFFCRLLPARILAKTVRWKVRWMAKRFLASETIEEAQPCLDKLLNSGRDATLYQLGEKVVSEREAESYLHDVLKVIRGMKLHFDRGAKNQAGILKAHISIRVSALTGDFNPNAPEQTYERVAPRLIKILKEAKREEIFVNIDAEHYPQRDLIFYIYRRVLLETAELKDFEATGMVVQCYLRDAYPHFEEILALAKERKIKMPIRLVKGAYWDAETIEAKAYAYDPPQFINKEETDIHFRQLIFKTLEAKEDLQLCLGSHNLADHCFARILRDQKFPTSPEIEHQCLHQTYESLSWGMAQMGWPVRNYMTIGSLLAGMAYLVRRILENSSQVGVLMQMRSNEEEASIAPHILLLKKIEDKKITRDASTTKLKPYFINTIPLRLYRKNEKRDFDSAFKKFGETQLGKDYSRDGYSGEIQKIYSPSDPEIFVGQITLADEGEGLRAVETANLAYTKVWGDSHPIERISILLKAADLLLLRRPEFASLMVHEGGKSFEEALKDVDEAIDFLNFYAKEEARLNKINKHLISRGVFAVIAPWNFPLAIPTGMSAGALAAGNAVILKPSEHTPLITQRLTEILYEAGIPKDAFIHLPGHGSIVGKLLVTHEKIDGIVFTGSKSVGMHIAHTAGKRVVHNELFNYDAPVKVITEMGGKNAILITGDADLDEAVSGVLISAFGNAGQKCSAASRILVDNAVKENFIERLKEACKDLRVGRADDYATQMNPLIAFTEKERLQRLVKQGIHEAHLYGGRVLLNRSLENLPGNCIGPTLIELPPMRAINIESLSTQELFGPIVHIIGYNKLKEAIQLFNATEYALTGGIYSQSQSTIDKLQKTLQAGNIYVNRPCTGARVAIEPFGGFKLSGTGPKSGSTFYLEAFHVDQEAIEKKFDKSIQIDKEGIEKLNQFIASTLPAFKKHHYWNRKIPGQLSFNDLNQIKEEGIYIALEDPPAIKTLLYLLAGLALGAKMEILCHNQSILTTWSFIAEFLYQCGYPRKQIILNLSEIRQSQKRIQEDDPHFIIIEGDKEDVAKILDGMYNGFHKEAHLKTILTQLDAPAMKDIEKYLEPFVQIRSFAINTMRYGAPMEIEP